MPSVPLARTPCKEKDLGSACSVTVESETYHVNHVGVSPGMNHDRCWLVSRSSRLVWASTPVFVYCFYDYVF